jgi:hypothetical protein
MEGGKKMSMSKKMVRNTLDPPPRALPAEPRFADRRLGGPERLRDVGRQRLPKSHFFGLGHGRWDAVGRLPRRWRGAGLAAGI